LAAYPIGSISPSRASVGYPSEVSCTNLLYYKQVNCKVQSGSREVFTGEFILVENIHRFPQKVHVNTKVAKQV